MIRFERGNAETERIPDVFGFVGLQDHAEFHRPLISCLLSKNNRLAVNRDRFDPANILLFVFGIEDEYLSRADGDGNLGPIAGDLFPPNDGTLIKAYSYWSINF